MAVRASIAEINIPKILKPIAGNKFPLSAAIAAVLVLTVIGVVLYVKRDKE